MYGRKRMGEKKEGGEEEERSEGDLILPLFKLCGGQSNMQFTQRHRGNRSGR
jgi:hypothetical protein